jgi:peptide-methionine (S)-S-oxide reductase
MGLANRLVPKGAALAEAIALAKDIARFPQQTMRSDRLSSYEQWHLPLEDALRREFHRGMEVLHAGGMLAGLEVFAKTAGRSGAARHAVLGTPMEPPFPPEMEVAAFAMGPFRAAERLFWQADGVYTTAAGHVDGAEAVRVVFDPKKTTYPALLRLFWEGHDPTRGSQRSAIYWSSETQRDAAEDSREAYRRALPEETRGHVRTEIVRAGEFALADAGEQQYLARHPNERVRNGGAGVRDPA